MKIFVKVKPSSRIANVEQIDAKHYLVSVTEPPVGGKANKATIVLLANYLKLPKSLFTIKRGETSKQKTIEIDINQNLF
ncbi:MAG: DUF167 domain-containing protein [Candidatus Berkelbacteria bacterium]|nr:DUF167 domain-containing protein [Candidatus Berkelbacteria bacterium]MCR4307590.1 DUF167 domain-containing protein [Candidatus Berkelbacteria bacterium]